MAFYFPMIETDERTRDFQEEFAGYNHNIKIRETDFYDMQNMTGDYYPVLSTRKKRGLIKYGDNKLANFGGLLNKGSLCYINDGHLYLGDEEIIEFANAGIIASVDYKKEMVAMGAYLVIFNRRDGVLQDGWYVNVENTKDCGYIEMESIFSEFKFQLCDSEGNSLAASTIGKEPNIKRNGTLWIDTSNDEYVLKKWSTTQSMWITITDTYIKIEADNIADGFSVNDAVRLDLGKLEKIDGNRGYNILIEQLSAVFNNKPIVIHSLDEEKKEWIMVPGYFIFAPGSIHITHEEDLYIDVENDIHPELKITKQAPYLDFVCESNNRLWGCRYGENRDGDIVNEIYACKQGNFKNWFCYQGISTDSYAVSVGSEGCWTGCIPYSSYVLFFKENSVHQIYGTMPSNYQLTEKKIRGVQKGCEKSLCIVNETLFYKSPTEFCYFDGSVPVGISSALGEVRYSEVICSTIKTKIYVNAKDFYGNWNLFVYDISTGLWHKEDNIQIQDMCRVDSDVYYVDSDGVLGTLTGTGTLEEDDFEWYAETGNIGYSYNDNKYVGRMSLRIQKPLTSQIRLLISYDDTDVWELVSSLEGQGVQSFSIPIMPRRCDHFRLRMEGKGECKVFSLSKTLEIGSDI